MKVIQKIWSALSNITMHRHPRVAVRPILRRFNYNISIDKRSEATVRFATDDVGARFFLSASILIRNNDDGETVLWRRCLEGGAVKPGDKDTRREPSLGGVSRELARACVSPSSFAREVFPFRAALSDTEYRNLSIVKFIAATFARRNVGRGRIHRGCPVSRPAMLHSTPFQSWKRTSTPPEAKVQFLLSIFLISTSPFVPSCNFLSHLTPFVTFLCILYLD